MGAIEACRTAARTGEVIRARWSEIDLKAKVSLAAKLA
jgi:integrase